MCLFRVSFAVAWFVNAFLELALFASKARGVQHDVVGENGTIVCYDAQKTQPVGAL